VFKWRIFFALSLMSDTIQTLLQQGLAHHQQARLQQAEDAYARVLQIDPRQFDALHLIGLIAKQRGDLESALNFFGKAMQVDPQQAKLHCNLGATLQEKGEALQALACYEVALRLQPDYAMAWNNRGNTLRSLQRYQEALDSFEQAMRLQINYPEAYVNRGICLQEVGEHTQAISDFEDAIRLRPNYGQAWFALGFSHQQLQQYEQALASYQNALSVMPGHSPAFYNRAIVLIKLERYAEALDDLQQVIEIQAKSPSAYLQRGHALRHLQRFPEAAQAYQTALEQGGDVQQLHYYLASLGVGTTPSMAPPAYVSDLFDQYAEHFDQHLQQQLDYQVPQLLHQSLQSLAPQVDLQFERALDLGCGTGLCAAFLKAMSAAVDGVDLSAKMLEKARQRGLYDRLDSQEIVAFLTQSVSSYDLMIAADVLVYFGDLRALFEAVHAKLDASGIFAFSVEASQEAEWQLQRSQRYAHSENYLRSLAKQVGFELLTLNAHHGRREQTQSVSSLIVVLRKT
jgi:predicted TPR repeat methyltransferase